jgi:hypothetical protein
MSCFLAALAKKNGTTVDAKWLDGESNGLVNIIRANCQAFLDLFLLGPSRNIFQRESVKLAVQERYEVTPFLRIVNRPYRQLQSGRCLVIMT